MLLDEERSATGALGSDWHWRPPNAGFELNLRPTLLDTLSGPSRQFSGWQGSRIGDFGLQSSIWTLSWLLLPSFSHTVDVIRDRDD